MSGLNDRHKMLRSHTSYAFGCKVTNFFYITSFLFELLCIISKKDRHNGRPVRYNNMEKQRAGTETEDVGTGSRFFMS